MKNSLLILFIALVCVGYLPKTRGESDTSIGIKFPVYTLSKAPIIDGDSNEWEHIGGQWSEPLLTTPSIVNRLQTANSDSWFPNPNMIVGVFEDTMYITVRWMDKIEDRVYRPWIKRGEKYRRGRKKDDMLAFRFHTGGDFSSCMLSGNDYTVDLWRWTAGRSQLAGIADDMTHTYSPNYIESAVVHQTPMGPVYIKNQMDEGDSGWRYNRRPKKITDDVVKGVIKEGIAGGSRADVVAKGKWEKGYWTLELSRKLNTGDNVDINFASGQNVTGQLAFFNAGYQLRKRITQPLNFRLSLEQLVNAGIAAQ